MDGISELRAASDSSLTGDPVRDGRVVGMKVGLPRAGMILVGDPVERRQVKCFRILAIMFMES
eukprot:SAG31_NODE_2817_length_5042_cov_32.133522_2_plen_63_part_00